MTVYYSHSTPGFFDDVLTANIPDDAVAVTPEKYQELMTGISDGHSIIMVNGQPEIGDRPVPLVTWDKIRSKRDAKLSACDWTMLPDVQMDEATVQSWKDYRQALRDITETYTDPNEVAWPLQPE